MQEILAQFTWYHNIALLEKIEDESVRLWYAAKALEAGWSRNVLTVQIENRRHLFDFLGTAEPRTERELEQSLVKHIRRFLRDRGADSPSSAGRCSSRLATATFASICFEELCV